jgi:hypothetical protein
VNRIKTIEKGLNAYLKQVIIKALKIRGFECISKVGNFWKPV